MSKRARDTVCLTSQSPLASRRRMRSRAAGTSSYARPASRTSERAVPAPGVAIGRKARAMREDRDGSSMFRTAWRRRDGVLTTWHERCTFTVHQTRTEATPDARCSQRRRGKRASAELVGVRLCGPRFLQAATNSPCRAGAISRLDPPYSARPCATKVGCPFATFGGCAGVRGSLLSLVWLGIKPPLRSYVLRRLQEGQHHGSMAPVVRRHPRVGVATRGPRHHGARRHLPQGRSGSRGGIVSDRCRGDDALPLYARYHARREHVL